MARLFHAAQLLLVALLLLLHPERTRADVTCTAGVFSSGTSGQITCNFGKDISKTPPRPNFNVMMYKYDDLQGDGIHVLLCNWNGDALPCNVKGDYSFNGNVTDRLVVDIPSVEKSMEGLYVCQLVPSGDDPVHTCHLNVTEGAAIPSHSITSSFPTTTIPTTKNVEEGAVSKNKTGVIIAVVVPILLLLLLVVVCCFPWLKFVKRGQQETQNDDEQQPVDWARYILFCRLVRTLKKKPTGEGSTLEAEDARVNEETESLIDIDIRNAKEASLSKRKTEKLLENTNTADTICKSENHSSCLEVNEVEGDRKDVGENVDVNVSGGVVGYKGEGKGDRLTPLPLTPWKHTNITVNVSQTSRESELRQSLNKNATEPGEHTAKEEVISGDNVDGGDAKKVEERVEAQGNGNKSTNEQLLGHHASQPAANTTREKVKPDNKPTGAASANGKADKPLGVTTANKSKSNTEKPSSRIEKNDEVDNRADVNVSVGLDVKGNEGKVNKILQPDQFPPTTLQELLQPDSGQNITQPVALNTRAGFLSTQPGAHTTQEEAIPYSTPLTKPPATNTHVAAKVVSERSFDLERNQERQKLQLQLQQARELREQLERPPQQQVERERQQQLERERQQQLQLQIIQRERERQQQLQRERLQKNEVQIQKERERQQQLEKERQQQLEKTRQQQLEKTRQQQLEEERQQQREKERQQQLEKERQQQLEEERQQQLEKERQQQLEEERQQQLEKERQQQLEKERQQQPEQERQQKLEKEHQQQLEKERQQQPEKERQQQLEKERQQQPEKEHQQQLETERQQQPKKERQQQLEKERQQQLEKERQQQLEKERQQQVEKERQQQPEKERQQQLKNERQQQLENEYQQQMEKERQPKADRARREELQSQQDKDSERQQELERPHQKERKRQQQVQRERQQRQTIPGKASLKTSGISKPQTDFNTASAYSKLNSTSGDGTGSPGSVGFPEKAPASSNTQLLTPNSESSSGEPFESTKVGPPLSSGDTISAVPSKVSPISSNNSGINPANTAEVHLTSTHVGTTPSATTAHVSQDFRNDSCIPPGNITDALTLNDASTEPSETTAHVSPSSGRVRRMVVKKTEDQPVIGNALPSNVTSDPQSVSIPADDTGSTSGQQAPSTRQVLESSSYQQPLNDLVLESSGNTREDDEMEVSEDEEMEVVNDNVVNANPPVHEFREDKTDTRGQNKSRKKENDDESCRSYFHKKN